MLRLGCLILTVWVVLNLLPAAYVVVSTTLWDADSPAIGQILDASEIRSLTEKERTSMNSVAVYANGLNVAFSVTVGALIWFGIWRRQRWAFWSASLGLALAVAAGALGDGVLGTVHPEVSLISAAILLVGMAVTWIGLQFHHGTREGS